MKSILALTGALACLTSLSSAETLATFGKVTLTLTRSTQDADTQNKTSDEHWDAVEADQNSTRVLKYSFTNKKVTNRQILDAMVTAELIPEVRGWALGLLHGEVIVAFKKDTPYVEVPDSLLTIGNTYGGVDSGKDSSKFEASKKKLTGDYSWKELSAVTGFALEGVALAGSESFVAKAKAVTTGYGTEESTGSETYSFSATYTLSGAGEDVFIQGKATASGKYPTDISSYLPPETEDEETL